MDKFASYGHPESTTLLRPEIGAQTHFKKKKPPQKYRYDDSLSPELEWDGQNPARELGEWLLARIVEASRLPAPHQFDQPRQFGYMKVFGLADAVQALRALGKPFLNWAGKAERFSFDVPTVPLFVHERLSTMAIIETLKGHKRDKQEDFLSGLFADPRQDLADQVTKAYEYPDKWVNRLILGDSLVVINSLLHYENLGGQVQMIYVDPPYGVKFGSNFQPFVRKRDVTHGEDEDMTREPEMVQAYRDTWELGLHSYLTYLRDRLRLARELLHPSGSVFVQISDENLHHMREVMDEVFGAENFVSQISFKKTGGLDTGKISTVSDYLVWFAKDMERLKYRPLFVPRAHMQGGLSAFRYYRNAEGEVLTTKLDEAGEPKDLDQGIDLFQTMALSSQGASANSGQVFSFQGKSYRVPNNKHWRFSLEGLNRLAEQKRIVRVGDNVRAVSYLKDFPFGYLNNIWTDTGAGSFLESQFYIVQTAAKVAPRLTWPSNEAAAGLPPIPAVCRLR
jgi:adenine-specific DNA-methyltransferase